MKKWFIITIFVTILLFFASGHLTTGWAEAEDHSVPASQQTPKGKDARQIVGKTRIDTDFGNIPLYFIPNKGQMNQEALFCAKTSRYTLWLTKQGLVFDSVKKTHPTPPGHPFQKSRNRIKPARDVSRLIFLNANQQPEVVPQEPTTHKVNYFKGKDNSQWHTQIPTSKAVYYKNLYKNTDLKIYGLEKQIEYDWVVKPGGNPGDIRFQYREVKEVSIDEQGNLVVRTAFGKWIHKKPSAYQEIGKAQAAGCTNRRIEVDVKFKKAGENTYSFVLGEYDKDCELIIDPMVVAFSTYLGGSLNEELFDIAVDGTGALIAVGYTYSTNFPASGAYQGTLAGPSDSFISKFSADGTSLVFSTYLGGSDHDAIKSIRLGSDGVIYVGGVTLSTDYPTVSPYQGSNAGGPQDGLISKLSADGATLLYSTFLGGSGRDYVEGIAVNSSGEICVAGITHSSDFPLQNAYISTYDGGSIEDYGDAFASKLSASGGSLVYSTYLGKSGLDNAYDIAVDSSGAAYVVGTTTCTNFPTISAFQSTLGGSTDGFITKFPASGTPPVFSTYLGGYQGDIIYDIHIDGSGGVYVSGRTSSSDFPTSSGAFQYSKPGGSGTYDYDGFIGKFTSTGTRVYTTYLGASGGITEINGITVDSSGAAYVTGFTESPNFPLQDAFCTLLNSTRDAVTVKLSANGSGIDFSSYLGSGDFAQGQGIGVDSSGAIYLGGNTGTALPTYRAYQDTYAGGTSDIFVTKIASCTYADITVTVPNGGDEWQVGSSQDIFWTAPEVIQHVKIEYSTDSGGTWNTITDSTPNQGGYTWSSVPDTTSANCLVRVSDVDAGGVPPDESNGVFTIYSQPIEVVFPNGGDVLMQEDMVSIQWTSISEVTQVELYYSTDSGMTWNLIDGPISNTGMYDWIIPTTPSTECLVKVKDADSSDEDISDAVFTIRAPSITIVHPNGNDTYMQEDIMFIDWNYEGHVNDVNIYYSTDSGTNWELITGPIPNTGNYEWLIPTTPSTECLVKVEDAAGHAQDISDALFTIRAPSITIVHPNGNATYMQEDIMFINWSYEGHVNDVNIYYSTDSGTNWELITGPIPNTGNYEWLIPATPSTECLVKVEDAAGHAQDISDALFTIRAPSITIVHPNGNTTYMQEDIMFIDWSYEGHVNNVNIYYTTDSGANWQLITGPISNTGNYEWLIPPTPSTQCLVKVEDAAGHAQDISDALFTIRAPSITIVHPNGNASYMQEDIMFIDWNYEGHVNNVNIYYATDSGANWQLITGPIPNTGNYEWLIPPTPSTQCLVKVEDAAGHAQDISDALFTILPPTITVIYPNGSEFLQADTLCSISWDYAGNIVDVLLQYSTDSGSTWNDIAGPIPNTGTYDWTVPNDPSSECLVKVLDAAMYAQDTSDALFTISPPSIPALQRDALIALYNSTDGDNWTDNTNWRLPGDPTQFNDPGTEHTWFGVTCTADHTNVIEINLPGNFLNGTLPDLSALTELTKLDLGNNQLTGTLPATLNNLANLQVLDLGANFITGTLPDLSGLTNLTQLNLSTNIFDGNIPTWISLLTALNTLNLSENQFTGTIPDLSTLTQLTEFNVYANQLSGTIPTWINSLTALNTLHLGLNQFSGEIPDLGSLTQLTQLNLYGNQLTGGIPTWINLLTALTKLDLSANQLTGTIPDISSLIALTDLYLQNNDLNGSIPDLSSLTSLEYLFLNNNQLSGSIPNISGLAALYRLDLSGNQLSGAIPSEIGTLTGLRYLLLHGNKLSGPLPSSITNLTNLLDNDSSIRWNALYTDDSGIRDFMNAKQSGGDWESTQTIAPTAVSAGEATHNSIKVSWTAIQYQSGAGGYMVYYTTTPGSGYTLSGTTPDKYTDNYTVTGLDPNTTYYFVVEAFTDSHANNQNTVISEYSTEASAATLETPTLTVTAPDGGQSWEGGTTQNITWNSTGSITDVKIEYSIDNGASWNTITASTANSGSYSWTVPNTPSSNCLVKISDTTGPASDTSNGVFTIAEQRTLTVTTPNGTETWEGGFNQAVTWNSTGTIANVMIEYSTDNGSTWNTVTASTANTGTYDWTVPNTPSSTCLVKVSDTAGPASDVSNAVFTILEQRTVTVIAPNDSENWMATSIHDITWLTTGAIGTVSIDYSTDSGGSWNSIVSSTPNTGSYSWTVPDTPSGTCLVRISDTAGPANDTSDAVFTISPAQISQSQRDALIALYNSTNGDSWTNNTNWRKPGEPTQFNDPGTEYTWYGVTCTTDNTNVEIVQIENNNLVGTIPVELNNLTTLTGLILNNNQLSGTMPDLSSLVNLTELKLSVNQLDGSIPAWLNNLVNLQIIHLNNNQFSGTIPDLSSLVNLTELNLAINSLSGTIPVWINNLTALTTIILSGNQLTGTIPDMGSLTQLLVLDLFTNQLTGTIPDLSGLVSLEKLRLGVNQLSGSIPVWINDLTTLQYLELPDNQFTGTIPYLGGLTQLKKLDLSENQLTGTIPAELGNLNALQTLWLGENQLDGAVPSDLGNLAALTWLNLNDNQLTGSIPTELGNISSLSYLHLDDNRLAGNIPAEIGNLTGLNSLRLNGNQLSGSIPGTLSNLTNLFTSYLDLSWNGLYTNDTNLRDFLNTKQYGGDWEITQTIAPTGLSTSEETHNSVKVSWTPIQYQGDSGEYRVYYTTTSGSDYTLAGNTADKTVDNYTVTALEANTTYYFVVETVTNQHINNQNTVTSEYSIEISTTTLETPTLTISVPNGGQSWEAATSQSITWNSTGNITDVKIEYSTDNGSSWSTVIASTPNNGSYDWTVPNTPSTTCLVKIADIGGLAEDTSDAVFTIAEQRTLTVTAPNGTENWEGGTDHTITWNSSGSIANVQIEYSTDNGSSWNTVEASATNDGNYNWTVPNTPSGNCLVRINDTAGPVTDTSNGVFTIAEQRTLTVTAPNGTENWEGGTSQTITWNSTGSIANVQIEYSTDNGNSWNTVEASTTNDGNYNWTVPNTPSTNCLVRISDTAGPATDTSNAVFTIAEQRTLTVTAPNGTESWEGGTSQTITWNSTGSIANVQIEYSTDNGSSWNTVEASTTNDGNYNWTVPNTNTPSTNCLVQISDTAGPATDTSNGVFTIIEQRTLSVTAPNGTENWEGGTDQTITWNSTGSIANVQIEYSTDNGNSWNTVEASTTNDGNYNWTVPNTPSTNCLVRISDTAGPATDTSNAVFTIAEQRTLTVTAPNGTENWEGGTDQTITWNSTGSIANVQIEYSTDNGNSWNTVEASTTNDGNYNWTVPNTPSTNCLVRISDTAGPATDTSNGVFTIAEQRTLTVTAPNGTENWEGGTNQTITWNSTGSISNVLIEYSTDNGNSWNTVEASTTNDGNYDWTVPNTPSGNCLVRISDTAGPTTDTSNGVFTIAEQRTLTATAPNGTENWEGGTNQTITWNSTGNITDVKIEYSTDTGASWSTVIASTPNTGSYNWTVPNTPSSNCLVKITDIGGLAMDTSDAVFTITEQRTLTVITPNGTENWEGGTSQNITWDSTGSIPNVKIEYSTNSGGTWNTIIASTANSGTYNWTVDNTPSTDCLVKVSDTAGPATDTSNGIFTILEQRTLTVITPNGTENWEGGTNQTITWNSTGSIANVKIDYSTDNGSSWNTVESSTTNDGNYNWTIPNTPSTNCLVRISDTAGPATDTSNDVFTIVEQRTITVNAPNGGQRWFIDFDYSITWTTTGSIASVMIEYSINNGSSWSTVVSSTTNSGSYNWTIPNTPSTNCLVRISDTSGPAVDVSNGVFTIDPFPTLTVQSPNGGQSWVEGTTQTITWSHTGTIDNVDIEFSANGGTSWNSIVSSTANIGSYNWIIPAVESANCLVRVSDTTTSASDVSNAVFALWKQPSITVTSPDGGETWKRFSNQTITWTTTGNIQDVKIQYSKNAGSSWIDVITSTPNDGSYQWNVPNVNKDKTQCLMKIMTLDGTVVDTSNNYFTISKF